MRMNACIWMHVFSFSFSVPDARICMHPCGIECMSLLPLRNLRVRDMTERLDNIRRAYHTLGDRVNVTLRTQVGDVQRLRIVRSQALSLASAAEVHRSVIPPAELVQLRSNIAAIIEDLDAASHRSSDPADRPPLEVVKRTRTGTRGRPKITIEPAFFKFAMDMGSNSDLRRFFNCCTRTVRRRAIEHELSILGLPVYTELQATDGSLLRQYRSAPARPLTLSDDGLDHAIGNILEVFPHFGRRMIHGHIKAQGQSIARKRIEASYEQVLGAPAVFGARRPLVWRKYSVPGPLSLVHHDGQHGLIHFKLITHCFIDGYSRRVRGDHGTENLGVAQWMEENKGLDRGSYIWGRGVHNTRIERLWVDVTSGYGEKWLVFFCQLEIHWGWDIHNPDHVWLLHHLFLPAINQHALEWAEAWNAHRISMQDSRPRSPRDMFTFGMVQEGPRGLEQFLEPIDDLTGESLDDFGIDWGTYRDDRIMSHFFEHNPIESATFTPSLVELSQPTAHEEKTLTEAEKQVTALRWQPILQRLDLFASTRGVQRSHYE
ncbi:hypothetical protein SCP_1502080 [Sparassis crispa]|uniref:Integrase core domain-containing protein n=1 Tax=Sparassis crispa TaxID=139825 RepID=A0A401H4C0_9APHY|nr:hypothetical protein SCP_1502080 [Sparassis crispa]GBE89200.1 hypothetical protein SCP_1502080 [Sparassis crispa]